MCLKNYPDVAAIDDAAREHGFTQLDNSYNSWRRSPRDDTLGVGHFLDRTGLQCAVFAAVEGAQLTDIFESRSGLRRIATDSEEVAAQLSLTGVYRLYQVDDERYVMIDGQRRLSDPAPTLPRVSITIVARGYIGK